VFFSRAWHKKSPFRPDNNHVHHLVLHFTKNHVMASLIIVASFTTTLVLFSQLAFTIGHEDTAIVFLVYLVVWYVVLFFIRRRVREERFR
jgi:RsiW-degrading membrane proteinase PrsW (M82 family)